MKGTLVVARREFRSAFNSPVAYVLIVGFLVLTAVGLFVVEGFFLVGKADLSPWFGLMPLAFVLLVPAATMRSWAEERRQGTYELLLTLPFSEGELVVGKFIASFGVIAAALLLSLGVPLSCSLLGGFDTGIIVSQYLGVLLLAAASVAIGEWVSSLAKNQVSAFVGSLFVILVFTGADRIGSFVHATGIAASVFNWLSLVFHNASFSRGVLDTRDLAFFVLATVFFLYLTAWNVRRRKWS
jgi:ABC-2 type transport system permease protein